MLVMLGLQEQSTASVARVAEVFAILVESLDAKQFSAAVDMHRQKLESSPGLKYPEDLLVRRFRVPMPLIKMTLVHDLQASHSWLCLTKHS